MSNFSALREKCNTDVETHKAVGDLLQQDLTPEQGVAAIGKMGYEITAEEWAGAVATRDIPVKTATKEVSEEELESVAGGQNPDVDLDNNWWDPEYSRECWFHHGVAPLYLGNTIYCVRIFCIQSKYEFGSLVYYKCKCYGTEACKTNFHNAKKHDDGSELTM